MQNGCRKLKLSYVPPIVTLTSYQVGAGNSGPCPNYNVSKQLGGKYHVSIN